MMHVNGCIVNIDTDCSTTEMNFASIALFQNSTALIDANNSQ